MKFYQFNNYRYLEKTFEDLTIEDFLVKFSDPHVSDSTKDIWIDVKLINRRKDVEEAMQILDISDKQLQDSRFTSYDFRGRRTDEQKQAAIEEAKQELLSKKDDFAERVFKEFKEYLCDKIERHRKNYLESFKREFKESDPIVWNEGSDELTSLSKELNQLNEEINKLTKARNEVREQIRKEKNKIFLHDLSSDEEDVFSNMQNGAPDELKEELIELAKEGKLFNERHGFFGR